MPFQLKTIDPATPDVFDELGAANSLFLFFQQKPRGWW
jgi:hypothetical protein